MKISIKKIIFGFIVIVFLATLPGAYQNKKQGVKIIKLAKQAMAMVDRLCDSKCEEFPKEWTQEDSIGLEEKSYCLRQCMDRTSLKKQVIEGYFFPVEIPTEYRLRVAQIHCVLGFFCLTNELEKLVE